MVVTLDQQYNTGEKLTVMLYTYINRHAVHAAAELGRNPVSKHQIQPEYGDEQADAGWDG